MFNDLKHGKGKEYYKNGNIQYEGDFIKDKYEGNGKYIYEDDNYYIGQLFNGLKHGKCKEYYKNGNIQYEGDFIKDKYEGIGIYIYENGNYYIGQWFNGLEHGKGNIIRMVILNMMVILSKINMKEMENIFLKMVNIILDNVWMV